MKNIIKSLLVIVALITSLSILTIGYAAEGYGVTWTYIYGGTATDPNNSSVKTSELWYIKNIPCTYPVDNKRTYFGMNYSWTDAGRTLMHKSSNVKRTVYFMDMNFFNEMYVYTLMRDYDFDNNMILETPYPLGPNWRPYTGGINVFPTAKGCM
jgi:hypothetical protein